MLITKELLLETEACLLHEHPVRIAQKCPIDTRQVIAGRFEYRSRAREGNIK